MLTPPFTKGGVCIFGLIFVEWLYGEERNKKT